MSPIFKAKHLGGRSFTITAGGENNTNKENTKDKDMSFKSSNSLLLISWTQMSKIPSSKTGPTTLHFNFNPKNPQNHLIFWSCKQFKTECKNMNMGW